MFVLLRSLLHTGLGTFRPIEVEDITKHKMDAEYYAVDEYACKTVNKAEEGQKFVPLVQLRYVPLNHLLQLQVC